MGSNKSKKFKTVPEGFFEKIEFDKIKHILIELSKGDETKDYFEKLNFLKSPSLINHELEKAKEYFSSFQQEERIPSSEFFVINHDLFLLSKENYLLEIESLFRINNSIHVGDQLYKFLFNNEEYPLLSNLAEQVVYDKSLVTLVGKVLDEEGNVRPDASPELLKINRRIQSKMRELDKEFDSLIKIYKDKNMLTDSAESYRNGRRVLSVPAENKRQINGVIHDESATGKTVFLEPDSLIKLNNDLFNFQNEYRQEINRILRQLCTDLRSYIPHIESYHELIRKIDIIAVKAKWARMIEGEFPNIIDSPKLHFKDAYHPLLKLKNEKENKETIPFNLDLHGKNRILLVSGPNAGGKSILMKSVILLHTMIQCGIPVPVHPDTNPGFFKTFIADIGDQQSIENDLSTYSSRLKIMGESLNVVNQSTLMVIDEFGSGTDPKFGGALAESMLHSFNKSGAYGVITTHYSNLKIFAYKTKGIVNGAMVFDQDNLEPTYKMKIGKPGSSFAFEIADKNGIPENVMKYARKKVGKSSTQVEDLLVNLQKEKATADNKVETLETKEKELERLISTYNQLHKELDVRRKKLKMEARESALVDISEQNKAFENLIRELREEKKLDEAKKLAAKLKADRAKVHNEILSLEEGLLKKSTFDVNQLKKGDFVRIGSNSEVGVIEWISKNKAELRFGNMTIQTKLKDLVPAKEPIETNRSRSVRSAISNQSQTPTKLDIRGMSKQDAIRITEEFFDKAILSNAHELTIIHGHGSGVLRKEVHRIAKDYKDIKKVFHPEYESGGDGVTIVNL